LRAARVVDNRDAPGLAAAQETVMNAPMPVQATAACAAITATRLREAAQAQIVRSFRAHLGGAPQPSDEQLILFARLAVSEMRLQRRLLASASAVPQDADTALVWER
jgi:hypothetical protein